MAYQEIKPAKVPKTRGTGVRISINDRGGMIVTLAGPAFAAIGIRPAKVKVFLDTDPVLPRLRILPSEEGPYAVGKAPRGDSSCLIRVGHRAEFGTVRFKGFDCEWEPIQGRLGLDIDLPRELSAAFRTVAAVPSAQKVKERV